MRLLLSDRHRAALQELFATREIAKEPTIDMYPSIGKRDDWTECVDARRVVFGISYIDSGGSILRVRATQDDIWSALFALSTGEVYDSTPTMPDPYTLLDVLDLQAQDSRMDSIDNPGFQLYGDEVVLRASVRPAPGGKRRWPPEGLQFNSVVGVRACTPALCSLRIAGHDEV